MKKDTHKKFDDTVAIEGKGKMPMSTRVGIGAAIGIGAASLYWNMAYGWSIGNDDLVTIAGVPVYTDKLVSMGAFALMDSLKASMVFVLAKTAGAKTMTRGKKIAASVGAGVILSFSVAASSVSSFTSQVVGADVTFENRLSANQKVQEARKELKKSRLELASLKGLESPEVLRKRISDRLAAEPGRKKSGCIMMINGRKNKAYGPWSQSNCPDVHKWRKDLQVSVRANGRREVLLQKIVFVKRVIKRERAKADRQSGVLVRVIRAIGGKMNREDVRIWTAGIRAFGFEFASIFALSIAYLSARLAQTNAPRRKMSDLEIVKALKAEGLSYRSISMEAKARYNRDISYSRARRLILEDQQRQAA